MLADVNATYSGDYADERKATLPAKLVEMAYGTNNAPNETRKGYLQRPYRELVGGASKGQVALLAVVSVASIAVIHGEFLLY